MNFDVLQASHMQMVSGPVFINCPCVRGRTINNTNNRREPLRNNRERDASIHLPHLSCPGQPIFANCPCPR